MHDRPWTRRQALAVLAGAFPSLDTAVNIAFPAIDEHFELDVVGLQWVVVSYLFTYGALLAASGRLGDTVGHRRLVGAGGVVSVVGLAGCAAAPTFAVFLVARVVQGIGTALVLAGAPALLTTAAEDEAGRGRAVSWFQAAAMIGLAVGPVIGGPLVELGGWRAVYWFRVPIAMALIGVAMSVRSGDRPTVETDEATDARGAPAGRGHFRRINGLTAVANAAMFPTWLLVPTLLVDEVGLSVVAAGLVLAASPLLSAAGSLWAGQIVQLRSASSLAAFGLGLLSCGLGVIALVAVSQSTAAIAGGLALVGLGLGIFSVPNMHQVMSALPLDRQGLAGGISLTMRTVGVVVGVMAAASLFGVAEDQGGFDRGFRIVFLIAAAIAALAAAVSAAEKR